MTKKLKITGSKKLNVREGQKQVIQINFEKGEFDTEFLKKALKHLKNDIKEVLNKNKSYELMITNIYADGARRCSRWNDINTDLEMYLFHDSPYMEEIPIIDTCVYIKV
jgi:predicted DNA-binding antitoxin AbrB/MazE fold protein